MCDSCEMPKYKCIKTVWALKIKKIELDSDIAKKENRPTDCSAIITPEELGYAPFRVSAEYFQKHQPVAGGYYVVYEDGYKSFSPADAFEKGYVSLSSQSDCDQEQPRSKIFSFSEAIYELKAGKKVAREGWNGKGMYLFLIGSDMSRFGIGGWTFTNGINDNMECLPFIAMKTVNDKAVPWLASQTDMLAEDWIIVE